jgi:hypothetical protein
MSTWQITAEYRSKTWCEVEAETREEAEEEGLKITDEAINGNLELYYVDVRRVKS